MQTQALSDRTGYIQSALAEVLAQHTARFDLRQDPRLTAAFEQPEQWVDWFQYESQAEGTVLRLQFNEGRIRQLLAESQIPAWTAKRPLTVVWLTLSGQWVTEDQTLFTQVQRASEQVGLPVVVPVLDLEELDAIQSTPLGVAQASQRYRGGAWVLADIKPVGGGWSASWHFGANQDLWHINVSADSLELLMNQGFTQTAQTLIQHDAEQKHVLVLEPLYISLQKVQTLSQFKNMMNYLTQLSVNESVSLVSIDKDVIVLELRPRGGIPALLQAIRAVPQMVLVPGGDTQNLMFRWLS